MYEAKGYAKEASNRHALTHAVDTATRVSEAMIATTMSFFNESSWLLHERPGSGIPCVGTSLSAA